MLPTYEPTPEKPEAVQLRVLHKREAAEYLGIREEDLLAHVRQGRLLPALDATDLGFRVSALDAVARWYDSFRRTRRVIAVTASVVAAALTIGGARECAQPSGCDGLLARLVFALGAGGFGLALRAHRLERENLSSPFPDYIVSYPFILIVNSFVVVAVLSLLKPTHSGSGFLMAAFPLGVVLALFAHPDHWIIPQWLRQGKMPGGG